MTAPWRDREVHYPDEATWTAARAGFFGASEAAALMGESPWSTPLQVYAARVSPQATSGDTPEHLYWGSALEAAIAAGVRDRVGRLAVSYASRIVVMHERVLRMGATLDGEIVDAATGESRPLEIKTSRTGDGWDDGVPRHYWWQVQHQLACTGAPSAMIACLIGGSRLVWADIDRDDIAIAALEARVAEMWDRIDRRDPPPAMAGDGKALESLYGVIDEPIVLDGCHVDTVRELAAAKAARVEADARVADLETRIKEALRGHTSAVLADGTKITWKEQSRKESVVKASTFRVLRIAAPKGEKE